MCTAQDDETVIGMKIPLLLHDPFSLSLFVWKWLSLYFSLHLSGSTNLNKEMTDINKAVMCFQSHRLVADARIN